MNNFKDFILTENKHYIGEKAGNILTALSNLSDDAENIGSRALAKAAQKIVDQIRVVLHGRWDEEDVKYLKVFQKIGVAIMKEIDEKGDLPNVLASSVSEIESLIDELQVPINSLAVDTTGEEEQPPLTPGAEIEA